MISSTMPKVVFKGKMFTITQQEVVDSKGVKHIIEKGYRPSVVTIIGITEDRKILMIKEFRSGSKDYILWLPGGRVKKNESFREAAVREFKEETGQGIQKMTLFHRRQLSDNFHGEGRIYLAKAIGTSNEPKANHKQEKFSVIKISLSDASEMALENQIPNEFFSYLILRLNYLIRKGKVKI